MDEALGCARVKVQYGDDNQKIEVNRLSHIMVLSIERVMLHIIPLFSLD
jgi:hypothetical protein